MTTITIKFDDMTTWPKTWIERCEIIATDMTFRNRETGVSGMKWTAEQVYNHHPKGELYQVNQWFVECVERRECEARYAAGEDIGEIVADIARRTKTPAAQEAFNSGVFAKRS